MPLRVGQWYVQRPTRLDPEYHCVVTLMSPCVAKMVSIYKWPGDGTVRYNNYILNTKSYPDINWFDRQLVLITDETKMTMLALRFGHNLSNQVDDAYISDV